MNKKIKKRCVCEGYKLTTIYDRDWEKTGWYLVFSLLSLALLALGFRDANTTSGFLVCVLGFALFGVSLIFAHSEGRRPVKVLIAKDAWDED